MTAKVEAHCVGKRHRVVSVDTGVRACINCVWYEQYHRRNRGNVVGWVPVSAGYCLKQDQSRGPLRQPCREFERRTTP